MSTNQIVVSTNQLVIVNQSNYSVNQSNCSVKQSNCSVKESNCKCQPIKLLCQPIKDCSFSKLVFQNRHILHDCNFTMMSAFIVLATFMCILFPLAHSSVIQLVIYDFDETITSQHIWHELRRISGGGVSWQEQVASLNNCSTDYVIEMFGGPERVTVLQQHLRHLSSNGIDLGIISFGHRHVIIAALLRVQLKQYFDSGNIFGRGVVGRQPTVKSKRKLISQRFTNTAKEHRLFVDNDQPNMDDVVRKGVAKIFDTHRMGEIVNGLNSTQLSWIESQCNIIPIESLFIEYHS